MRITGRRRPQYTPQSSISQYGIGQRIVQLVLWSDGHTRWTCNCERYRASMDAAQGPWCKHVAKAAAIRSIERLTGERVISRATIYPGREPASVPAAGHERREVPARGELQAEVPTAALAPAGPSGV